jgi:hypothetical protein
MSTDTCWGSNPTKRVASRFCVKNDATYDFTAWRNFFLFISILLTQFSGSGDLPPWHMANRPQSPWATAAGLPARWTRDRCPNRHDPQRLDLHPP